MKDKNLFKTISLIIFLFIAFYSSSFSQMPYFTENKNQWPANVLYKSDLTGGALFLEKGCFTYCFFDLKDLPHSAHYPQNDSIVNPVPGKKAFHKHVGPIMHWHAYKVEFLNHSANVRIMGDAPKDHYSNYFSGNDPSKWSTRQRNFERVIYEEIYKNIDLEVISKDNKVKYNFIIKPGGNTNDIQLKFNGVKSISIKNNQLHIKTSVNELIEDLPVSFQEIGSERKYVRCEYKLNGNILTFNILDDFNKAKTLIIDPSLVFSTYSGSKADNWGFTATYDNDGNVYSGGIVHGVGYPVTTGAFQTNYGGNWDVGILKFSPNGIKLLYATYLGGTSSEMPHSMIVNKFNELIILGTTGSANFPIGTKAYDKTFNGGDSINYVGIMFNKGIDIYVAKLSSDGSQLLSSTFIGGSHNDGLNFRPEYNEYEYYGNGGLYYNYGDGARGEIITDDQNNVYIGTCTFSSNFPITIDAFQKVAKGKQEGIVFKLDYNLSNLVWSAYIGGSEDDAIYSIDVDKNYNLFVAGGTMSNTDTTRVRFPVTAGSFLTKAPGGNVDAFLAKISQDGSRLLASTFYGSDSYDQAYFVRSDKNNYIYIFGQTEAKDNKLIFKAPYNNPNSGQFIAKFTPALNLLSWSTVFGSGTGIPNISPTAFAIDICNRIYLSGSGREWPDEYYSKDPINDSILYRQFDWDAVKGTKNLDVTKDAFQSKTDGKDFYFLVLKPDAAAIDYATYIGELYDGGRSIYKKDIFGSYHLEEIIGCPYSGHDHVDGGTSRFDKYANIFQSVCASCGACQAFPTTPGVWSASNNSYNCNNAVMRFNIHNDMLLADFVVPKVGCAPYKSKFINTSNVIDSTLVEYKWDFGEGGTSREKNPLYTFTKPGIFKVKLIVNDLTSCNLTDTVIKDIMITSNTIHQNPDIIICLGQNVKIGFKPNEDPTVVYRWFPGKGLNDSTISNPIAAPKETISYHLVTSNGRCSDTLVQKVVIEKIGVDFFEEKKISCYGVCDGVIALNGTGSKPFKYVWENGNETDRRTNLCASKYTVTVTDKLGCQNTVSYQLNPPEKLKAIIVDSVHSVCRNICSGKATAKAIGGTGPYSYGWSNGQNDSIATNLCSGTYLIIVSDKNGCSAKRTIKIDSVADINIEQVNLVNNNCFGECKGIIEIRVKGSTGPYKYLWNNNPLNTDSLIKNLCVGEYSVKVTDKLTCTKEKKFFITQPFELNSKVNIIDSIKCYGGKAEAEVTIIGGNSPFAFQWNDPGKQQTKKATNLMAGLYSIAILDNNLCTDTVSVVITQPLELKADIDIIDMLCPGNCNGIISITPTGGKKPYQYIWDTEDISTNSTLINLCEGKHKVRILDKNGCILEENSLIVGSKAYKPEIKINAEKNIILLGQKIRLTSTNGLNSYIWSPEDGLESPKSQNTMASPVNTITYKLTVKDKDGCENSDTITIKVRKDECNEPYIFVPNAFTPEIKEGNNDVLYVRSNIVEEMYFVIYNRWGEKVFESKNINTGWDGTFNGEKVKPAVFVYYLKATCYDGQKFEKKGNVTLLR